MYIIYWYWYFCQALPAPPQKKKTQKNWWRAAGGWGIVTCPRAKCDVDVKRDFERVCTFPCSRGLLRNGRIFVFVVLVREKLLVWCAFQWRRHFGSGTLCTATVRLRNVSMPVFSAVAADVRASTAAQSRTSSTVFPCRPLPVDASYLRHLGRFPPADHSCRRSRGAHPEREAYWPYGFR